MEIKIMAYMYVGWGGFHLY